MERGEEEGKMEEGERGGRGRRIEVWMEGSEN